MLVGQPSKVDPSDCEKPSSSRGQQREREIASGGDSTSTAAVARRGSPDCTCRSSSSTAASSARLHNNSRIDSSSLVVVSDSTISTRLAGLWTKLMESCRALALHGYERTAIAIALPHFQRNVLNHSCAYLYERCVKRLSPEWQEDEPAEVVALCTSIVECYKDIRVMVLGAGRLTEGEKVDNIGDQTSPPPP